MTNSKRSQQGKESGVLRHDENENGWLAMWALEAYDVAKSDKEIACFLLEHSNQPCMSYMETTRIRRKPCISTRYRLSNIQDFQNICILQSVQYLLYLHRNSVGRRRVQKAGIYFT